MSLVFLLTKNSRTERDRIRERGMMMWNTQKRDHTCVCSLSVPSLSLSSVSSNDDDAFLLCCWSSSRRKRDKRRRLSFLATRTFQKDTSLPHVVFVVSRRAPLLTTRDTRRRHARERREEREDAETLLLLLLFALAVVVVVVVVVNDDFDTTKTRLRESRLLSFARGWWFPRESVVSRGRNE